ncbi:MAG: hypothetical protein M1546_00035, partial [Chloroflexi bacterium]|nr:hypothetical protein [Chloroflexota bacterium]
SLLAHMLYGGVLLTAACLIMLIFATPTAHRIGSFLTGVGLGLFFDEVGKFITADNDYFYKPAAPIIYMLSLGIAFLYYGLRRRSSNPSDAELVVAALEDAEAVLEGEQTEQQHRHVDANLDHIITHLQDPDHVKLALALRAFADSEAIRPGNSWWQIAWGWLEEWALRLFVRFHRPLTFILMAILCLNSLTALLTFSAALALPILAPELARAIEAIFVAAGLRALSPFLLSIDSIDLLLHLFTTLLTLYGVILFVIKRRQQGLFWIQLALILELCVVNVFRFYLEQFSAAIFTLANLALLLIVRVYQHELEEATLLAEQQNVRVWRLESGA